MAIDPGGCGHWYWRHISIGLHASLIHIGDREQCTDDAYYAHHCMHNLCVLLGLLSREILKDAALPAVVFLIVLVPALGVDRLLVYI